MKRSLKLTTLAALLAFASAGLAENPELDTLRIAVLPDEDPDYLRTKYAPLQAYLQQTLALEVDVLIPTNYQNLLDEFNAGNVDLAWFGGLTYVQAENSSQARPLVSRDVDLGFTSCYLATASETRRMIEDFEGEHFAFGPTLSTSGHLMPRHFLLEKGLDPETHFGSVRYSAGHDQTATWVRDGKVSLGVANCSIVQAMFDDGRLTANDVLIVQTTPIYTDYVFAVSASLPEHVSVSLLNAFLSLDPTDPEHLPVLRALGANMFLPVGPDDFSLIRQAANEAGLLAE